MFGATNEQQDDIARAARAAGGYFELVERRVPAAELQPASESKPTYRIDPATRQAHLVSAG